MDNVSIKVCNTTVTNHLFGYKPVRASIMTLFSVLIVLTITGNLLVIVTVTRRHRFRQKATIFVLSLAIADCNVAIFVMLFSVLQHTDVAWFNEQNTCLMAFSFDVLFTSTSILHLMCMTIDRFIAISFPLKYFKLMNRKCVITLLSVCWILPTMYSFGLIFGEFHLVDSGDNTEGTCNTACLPRVSPIFGISCSVASFYVPSVFMLICNIKLFLTVKRRGRKLNELCNYIGNSQRQTQLKNEVKVARTIVIMLGCFFVCWLPYFVVAIVDPVTGYSVSSLTWMVVTWLGYVNSTINPYLYYFLNRQKISKQKRKSNPSNSSEKSNTGSNILTT